MMVTEVKGVREGYKMTELGEIPEEWEVKNLIDLSTKILDGVHATPKYTNVGVKFLSVENVTQNNFDSTKYISQEDHNKYSKRCFLEKNDILMTRIGTIGVPKLVDWEFEASIYVSLAQIKLRNKDQAQFITQYMMSSIFKAETLKRSLLSATPQKINLGDIGKIPIILPSIHEQQKIAEILSTVDETIETTDQLLEKTKELKKGLMQQLLTKGIGHTEFKKTELGEIPVEWEVGKLSTLINKNIIVSHIDGNHGSLYPKATEFVDEGVPYVSANSIERGRINFSKTKFLPVERARRFKKGVAIINDVLFAHNATVGPIALLKTSEPFVILSTSLTLYRCDKNYLIPEFLLYYLSSNLFIKQYRKIMSQTTRNQVPITTQRSFLFILPSIKEQQRIAEILSSVDEQIDSYTKEKERLQELKKGLMQQLLTGKVRVTV
jgi:type I restriction enzyme, S subunit